MQNEAFRNWRKLIGLPEVAWKESSEETAATVALMFDELGFLGALDYSKAYDKMAMVLSCKALKATGVDEALVDVFEKVWAHHKRMISFDVHMSTALSETFEAHPQAGLWEPRHQSCRCGWWPVR